MAWGKAAATGIDDLAQRLQNNDAGLKSLTILRFRRLNEEDVEQLSKALAVNTVLEELICCSHAISSQAACSLGAALRHNSSLQRISIGNSSFGDQALDALVNGGLLENTGLTHWDLENKGLSSASCVSISRVLQQHPKLQELNLSRNNIGNAGLRQLCGAPWGNLISLNLSNCNLSDQALRYLSAAPVGHLQHLDLSHNSLGSTTAEAAAHAAEFLGLMLVRATQLRSLVLKGSGLGDAGAEGIAYGLALALLTSLLPIALTKIDLSDTGLSDAGVKDLAAPVAAVGARVQLQQVLLGGNAAISDDGICKLAESLRSAAAAARVSQPGQQRQQQLLLDLSQSGVGAEGIRALCKIEGLTHLSLFGCKLGGATGSGCAALVECIAAGDFANLQELNITGTDLTLAQMEAVMVAMQKDGVLDKLNTLEIGANPGIQEDGFEPLVSQLRMKRPGLDVHWRVADSDDASGRT